jgi:hypothetical protein
MKAWQEPIVFYRCWLDTSNFQFEAFHTTAAHARSLLVESLQKHATDYDLAPDWWEILEEDIYIMPITLGQSYRDRHPLLNELEA